MPSNTLATAAFLVLAPSVALAAVPAVHATREPTATPRAPTSGTAPPQQNAGVAQAPLTTTAAPNPKADRWIWPLTPRPAVLRTFVVGPYRWSAGHRGVDLAARPGTAVQAPAAGVVTFARNVVSRPVLVITHDNGVRTTYEPVAGTVPFGARVSRGAVIGTVADVVGHCGSHTCMHWGARRGDRYIDPLGLLTAPRIVLLPLPRGSPAGPG
jgi:murein DD-endopeptidase MepM/ murein hydrolase activator NlpD